MTERDITKETFRCTCGHDLRGRHNDKIWEVREERECEGVLALVIWCEECGCATRMRARIETVANDPDCDLCASLAAEARADEDGDRWMRAKKEDA